MQPHKQSAVLAVMLVATLCVLGSAAAQTETGYVQIIADPGVQVFMNDKNVGVTNREDQGLILINLREGRYEFRFERPGFEPLSKSLAVSAEKVTVYTLYGFAPEPRIENEEIGNVGYLEAQTGTISLTCLPVYCSVTIPELGLDEYDKGTAPLTISDVLATSYNLEVRAGSRTLREKIQVQPFSILTLLANFSLRRPALHQRTIELPTRPVPSPRVSVQLTPPSQVPARPTPEQQAIARQENMYEVTIDQPLAVLLDNADAAYPQQGLAQASSVFEMPVEGGRTTFMSVYTDGDPAQVGPITSARDYFLEAALAMSGTLVHVGGAPSTLARIVSQQLATVDALQEGALFAQAPDRLAPHSTFSTGPALRDAVGRLEQQVNGTLFVPPEAAANAASVTVNYSADYSSGFRYLPELDQYRWVRSGADAGDTNGAAITADAVVVAQVTAFPYPDDLEGRLYLPYSGGAATLFMRGKAIPGSWTPEGGFRFVTAAGEPVDLRPFKAWLLFAPDSADVRSG